MGHPYIPNSIDDTKKKMLDAIGIQDLDDLFSDIPENLRLRQRPKLPQPHSEVEVKRNVEEILSKNVTDGEYLSFLGAGVWAHNVPAAVDSLAGRTEFLTSYTPYQPEVSQGMLQALYEYQSLICELLDMEVVDSSMYDWATALGEAARMANRVTGRTEFLYPHHIHPERLATLRAYSEPVGIKLVEVQNNPENGQINLEDVEDKVCDQTAGLYVENPSYLGPLITNLEELAKVVHDSGGLLVAGVDPTSLGLVKPPGQYGADIAVGEGQPLGSYPNYGGPLLGIFGARDDPRLLRQVPGRIIGMTTARGGETGYCMVLQTREQHIRREKATSNICSNEALLAIRAAVYLALLGPEGMRSLGEYVTTMSNYLACLLSETSGIEAPYFAAPHFKEFTVRLTKKGKTVPALNQNLLAQGIFGGLPLERDFPELEEACLLCVTERHTREDLEKMSNAVRCFMKEE